MKCYFSRLYYQKTNHLLLLLCCLLCVFCINCPAKQTTNKANVSKKQQIQTELRQIDSKIVLSEQKIKRFNNEIRNNKTKLKLINKQIVTTSSQINTKNKIIKDLAVKLYKLKYIGNDKHSFRTILSKQKLEKKRLTALNNKKSRQKNRLISSQKALKEKLSKQQRLKYDIIKLQKVKRRQLAHLKVTQEQQKSLLKTHSNVRN